VSPALPSLLSSSPIIVALELHHALASTTHPSPYLISPGSLTDDPTAAGARNLAVDRSSQAPSGQIGPTTVIPYPARALPPLRRYRTGTPAENRRGPHRQSGSDRFAPLLTSSPPPSLWHVGTRPRHRPRAVPPAGRPSGPPARAPARGWAESPPAQLAEQIPFLFLFPFSFPIFIYMFMY
jgi:hypothetical protein